MFAVVCRLLLTAGFLIGSTGTLLGQSFEKMDDTWTVMVNGQSVRVEPDGSFTIPNVSAPDQFGAGGPGTAPDFVSDDLLRVIGISTSGGRTRYAYSDRFRFRRGQQFSVGMMTITNTPPPFPQAILIQSTNLLQVGQSTPLQVFGRLIDGSEIDVSAAGTTYRTSNLSIATVDEFGTVSALGPGNVLLTALNEGATATRLIHATTSIRQTTVSGLVVDESGGPVVQATVTCPNGETAMTNLSGSFQVLCAVAEEDETISVVASGLVGGFIRTGRSEEAQIVLDGFTDVGFIVLRPFTEITIDFDAGAGSPPSYIESGLTVVSLWPNGHLHLEGPDLLNHAGCCSPPYEFTFGGMPFNVLRLDGTAFTGSGTHTFTSSNGATFTLPAVTGPFAFPVQGWQGITSFQWNVTGSAQGAIDNLVIEVPASAR